MVKLAAAGFDWDAGNREKCQQHGVSIREIEGLFRGPVDVFPDPGHSQREERFHAFGKTEAGRHVFVVYTVRQRGTAPLIRPVSARYMHRREVTYYEKEIAKTEE